MEITFRYNIKKQIYILATQNGKESATVDDFGTKTDISDSS